MLFNVYVDYNSNTLWQKLSNCSHQVITHWKSLKVPFNLTCILLLCVLNKKVDFKERTFWNRSWTMLSHKFCYKETCGFTYKETVYMSRYTDVLHADIPSGENLFTRQIFAIFPILCQIHEIKSSQKIHR